MAKRQGREKPVKIEQRKVWEPEWGPQVEQTALLASPIYIGQAQGEEKTYKKRSQRAGVSSPTRAHSLSLFSSHLLGWHALIAQGCIFLYFLNKTELSHRAVTLWENCDMQRPLTSVASNLCCDETDRGNYTPPNIMIQNSGSKKGITFSPS